MNTEKKLKVELTVAKHKFDIAPIPVIGVEPALDSASKELAIAGMDISEIEGDDKQSRIAVLAYYKAEARGYEPGYEMQDWLDAEVEIIEKAREEKIK